MLVADTLVAIGLATVSLGTIQEADGVQERTFWLRNDGTEAVVLVQGYTSCGCTTIQFAKDKPVSVGDSTCVTLRFNPQGKGGDFEETGTIVYSLTSNPSPLTSNPSPLTPKKRLRLSMTGTCITSEETLMRQFPIRINDHLRLSANRFDLGRMVVGETKERSVMVLHRDDGNRKESIPITFTVQENTAKGLQHIACPITVTDGGKEVQATVTLDVFIK